MPAFLAGMGATRRRPRGQYNVQAPAANQYTGRLKELSTKIGDVMKGFGNTMGGGTTTETGQDQRWRTQPVKAEAPEAPQQQPVPESMQDNPYYAPPPPTPQQNPWIPPAQPIQAVNAFAPLPAKQFTPQEALNTLNAELTQSQQLSQEDLGRLAGALGYTGGNISGDVLDRARALIRQNRPSMYQAPAVTPPTVQAPPVAPPTWARRAGTEQGTLEQAKQLMAAEAQRLGRPIDWNRLAGYMPEIQQAGGMVSGDLYNRAMQGLFG